MKPRFATEIGNGGFWLWTRREILYVKKNYAKKTAEQIGRFLRRSTSSVQGLIYQKLGRIKHKKRTLSRLRKILNAKILRIRVVNSITEALISCPTKGVNCLALSPRWLQATSKARKFGECYSCSTLRGGSITYKGYKIYGSKFHHRIVVENHIGRKLSRRETIHHRNGNRLDNRISNLQIRFGSHPQGISAFDMKHTLETTFPGVVVHIPKKWSRDFSED